MVVEFTAGWARKYVDRRAIAQVYGQIMNQHFQWSFSDIFYKGPKKRLEI